MLVIRIWNYFRGYVIIKIEGLTLERFINLSIAKGIYLWDIERIDYTTIKAKVSIKGFKEIKEIVRRVGCRVTIIDKKGYPFVIHKLKYRKMLVFGFVISLGIIFFLTSFIWNIDVIGNEKIKDNQLTTYLENLNIKPGILRYKINITELENKILADFSEISYANAQIQGTKLIIEIREKREVPNEIKSNEPCNIVAKKKAVIEKVIAKNGKGVVEKGDIVKEGQVLITGIIQDAKLDNPLLVHSEGIVLGRTVYTKIVEEPIEITIKEETGRVHTAKEIKIFNKKIQLMSGEIPFENYIEEIKTKKILADIPMELTLHEYKEVSLSTVKQNVDSLKKITSVKGVEEIMKELPKDVQVVSKDVSYTIKDNYLITKIVIEVIEDIAQKEKIQLIEEDRQ